MNDEVKPAGLATSGTESMITRREKWTAALLLLAAFALRCLYIFRYRYDSDEPQHLHTTWGWTQGLLQYRDFFDNHTPLFHILFSPLVALLGERTDILDYMRFAMVPLWFVSLWCVSRIGRALFSPRVGMWAAVTISLLPWWFYPALEYRTDNLWTPLWLGAIATLACGTFSRTRAFFGGLLLGFCATASMKTTLLCAVLAMSVVFTCAVCIRRLGRTGIVRILTKAWPLFIGLLFAPAIVAAFFYLKGAWDPFVYGVIKHNLLLEVDDRNHPKYLRLIFPIVLPFVLAIGAWIARAEAHTPHALRRAGLFIFVGLYYAALYSFWTLLTRQDYLPFYPLAMVLVAALLVYLAQRFVPAHATLALAFVAVLEIVLVLAGRKPWENGTLREREILGEFLRLTKPGEWVMDFKGESVFRRRAFFYVTEPLTFYRLRRKMLKDTVADDLLGHNVFVVLNQNRWFPKDGAKFMEENYLAVGRTRVAGKVVTTKSVTAGEKVAFDVKVPGSYVLWADGHIIVGSIDGGAAGTAPRELIAGPHEFSVDGPHKRVAIFWSRAAEAGFQPVVDKPAWQYYR
jgi:hypothetical protein